MSAMATHLVVTVLAVLLPTATAVTAGRWNCSALCGPYAISYPSEIQNYIGIPYPFGISPECSLPGFNLTCALRRDNTSILLLGNPAIEVRNRDLYSSVPGYHPYSSASTVGSVVGYSPFPTVGVRIGYLVKMTRGVRDHSLRWEAPGKPFAISASSNMSLFIVGCGVTASLVGDSGVEMESCSVVCVRDEIMRSLPGGLCVGIGCCRIDIKVRLRAFTVNISRADQAARTLEQVNAFITYRHGYQFWSSHLGSDLSGAYPAELSWAITYQPNCRRAMEDRASYACISSYSKCEEAPADGYLCSCSGGFSGNPYVDNGCVPEVSAFDSMQPKENCPTSCGNVSVAFPFGIQPLCFAKLQLYLTCNPGPSRPVLQMPDGSVVTDIYIDEGILRVLKSPNRTSSLAGIYPPLYAFSSEWGVVKWAVDNMTCKDAMESKQVYRCFSHSDCLNVVDDRTLEHVGYRCRCSPGFRGNPYIKDGCTDIDECQEPDKYNCNGICQNDFGSYTCNACPHGTDFNEGSRKCKPSTAILGVTVGLSSGGGILAVAAVAAILARRWKRSLQKRLRRRYFHKNKGILLEQLISSDKNASDGMKIFSLEELEKATNNFDHTRVVGRGGHGTVYKGILTDQRVVAIKRSKLKESAEIEQFINEVSILSRINHRNVVKLHGCCLEAEVPLLVYEFISNGTLYDLLHCKRNGPLVPLPWEERLRIAIEIAGALTYLHSAASVSILHRDVKCTNILMSDSYAAKVSDFGASKSIPIDQTHLITAVQGTFGYLDPEYFHTGQFNEKSDVYSFGVILLELLTKEKPIFEDENGEKQNLSNYFLWAVSARPLEEVVDRQILGEASEEAIQTMARLAEECLSLTRGERPTMKDVEMRLQMLRARQSVAPRATKK